MKNHGNLFGNIYAAVMVALCVLPIIWMFQFFWLVPGLQPYFLVTLLVPISGLGIGLRGLWITRNEKTEDRTGVPENAKESS